MKTKWLDIAPISVSSYAPFYCNQLKSDSPQGRVIQSAGQICYAVQFHGHEWVKMNENWQGNFKLGMVIVFKWNTTTYFEMKPARSPQNIIQTEGIYTLLITFDSA